MSNRELVIDLVQRFPEDTPLLDIAHKIEFIAGVKEALAEADRGEGIVLSGSDRKRALELLTAIGPVDLPSRR